MFRKLFRLIPTHPGPVLVFLFMLLLSGNTVFTAYSFLATGGTTTRTMPDRLADIRNAKDFGIVNDSTNCLDGTDNAAAFQAAVTAIGAGGEIFVPPGRYKVASAINLDALGNGSFTIRGAGGSGSGGTEICGNIADFIFRRVIRNPASPTYTRVIDNINVTNLNTTAGANINLSSTTWAANVITFVMATPHGITVGDTRLINITGVTGVTQYNGRWGVTATTATAVTTAYDTASLGAGTGGVFNIMPGGAIAMQGSLRGSIQNIIASGFYPIYAEYDATISVYNATVFCQGSRLSGTIGVFMSGEMGMNGFDITSCDIGIATAASGAVAGIITNGRVEVNNTGLYLQGSAWSVTGTSFESNQSDAITIYGSSVLNFSGINVIGSGSSVNGLHISGGCLFCTFQNMNISGTFSGAAVTVDSSNTQGSRLSGIIASCAACTQTSIAATGIQIDSSNFSSTYTVATRPLSAGGSPPQEGDVLRFSDIHNTDAVWGGVVGVTGTGTNHRTARYSSGSNTWIVIGQY